jgi:hypothetical protein
MKWIVLEVQLISQKVLSKLFLPLAIQAAFETSNSLLTSQNLV